MTPGTEKPEYCQARTRRQEEAASWGEAHVGCGNKAKYQGEDKRWYCHVHIDPKKRY